MSMFRWLRQRKSEDLDEPHIIRKGDGGERRPDVDPLDELVRIVGEISP